MKVKEVVRMLKEDGWFQVRQISGHRHFYHLEKPGTVAVAGKENVDVPPGTLNSIYKQAGWPKKYAVLLERGPESWGASVPDLPGCVAVGETREEALALIREAVDGHIETMREAGEEIPQPSEVKQIEILTV